MKIIKLEIMLPYMNDIYAVGKRIEVYSQSGSNEPHNNEIIKSIQDNTLEFEQNCITIYQIDFVDGSRIILEGVPVRVEYVKEFKK